MRFLYVHRDDIRKWQLATLEIQQVVQNLFDEYEISGWCGGGSLIGAVRNGGFLYWDNDLDMFFKFQDYKRIIMAFRERKLLDAYDLIYFRNGYWQKNYQLMNVLRADLLNKDLLDFDIAELAKGMFKIFSRKGIKVRFFSNDFDQPKEYVRLQHFAPIHYTRNRLAAENIEIDCSMEYKVLPEVCMLPMMEMTCNAYLSFLYRYSAKSVLAVAAKTIDYPEQYLEQINAYPDMRSLPVSGKFDKGLLNPIHARASLLLRNLVRGTRRYIEVVRQCKKKGGSGKLIVYRPVFFRFFVMPFLFEDIFPLKKTNFEETTIYVPNKSEAVLTTQFGDYMRVPDVRNRIAYPFFFENQI